MWHFWMRAGKLKYSYGKDYDPYVEKELEEYLEYDRKEGKSHQGRLLPAVLTEKNIIPSFWSALRELPEWMDGRSLPLRWIMCMQRS